MKTLFSFIVLLFIWTESSFCQRDSLLTIQLHRINNNGDTITKTVVPWKVFNIYTQPDLKKHTALAIDYAGDSSIIITTKAIPPRNLVFSHDTILYKDILIIKARTKHYNLRRGLGITALLIGSIATMESIAIAMAGYPKEGLVTLFIGTSVTLSSIPFIRMRKFNIQNIWKIKSGYLID